ncbi:MAG: 2-oxoisovalerate dehydrogenase [Candidatus Wildermuthbacteria bacterium RIFCSPHIGHO2_01_FULL_47_27]|uniref:2-oxoisovalerate dehydrogenase n=2 Tax=Candidatus Wildermuthiibacteriota TaxID=1817923 RepID=A0A1G2RRV3_9BACT|nr:MAG: Pyruvate dehydrogenase E1 component subunit beta [Parcubacteria group bacterium GW2011_GWA2_47_9]OHA63839.1 MAG: 2-oxoisovalerate dehydrogenase [Candidatus Wildermuthbacteria bacterium RIFCSPHIGHO2_01_FULL_47_27]OHA68384.1 MAG: 2-oxoisovalerate dehydrogenase [Candidatus Wildermuthbacteria bacterium RIFCSPHIGHO2_02_FULL_47_17]OHA75573.1 MAG: 2-oxoisovalerate dehydrogenase [Candidatus Wildermuthbacteria bacterium RIFCSPLOWO2_01_FULL_48_35]
MPAMNLVQAINNALEQEMERDKSVILLGEDIGKNGGVFRVTEGLWQKFGAERVIDTPLAEVGIISTALGLAVAGMKPIPEVQFDGFSIAMFDQLYNHISRMRKRSQGRYHVPLVLRVPHGGGIKAYEHHSESLETYFCHMPGLKVVAPSRPYNAKGLLISAIRDPDPVIFLEPKRVYRAIKEEVPEEEYEIPIGKAEIVQEGSDITLIAWGAMQKTVRQAADDLADKYSIEIIDLLTLSPLDRKTIVDSVKKTGRCVVAHEAPKTCGFGAELAATIQEEALLSMKAPVARVTGYDIPMPMAKLENYQIPDAERVAEAVEKAMKF